MKANPSPISRESWLASRPAFVLNNTRPTTPVMAMTPPMASFRLKTSRKNNTPHSGTSTDDVFAINVLEVTDVYSKEVCQAARSPANRMPAKIIGSEDVLATNLSSSRAFFRSEGRRINMPNPRVPMAIRQNPASIGLTCPVIPMNFANIGARAMATAPINN